MSGYEHMFIIFAKKMARPEKCRKIGRPPSITGFVVKGTQTSSHDVIQLTYEEYESLRLIGYESKNHVDASEIMGVSRPTMTRIYSKAVYKICKAMVEGQSVEITGGNYRLEKPWYRCRKCHRLFDNLDQHVPCKHCREFGIEELIKI